MEVGALARVVALLTIVILSAVAFDVKAEIHMRPGKMPVTIIEMAPVLVYCAADSNMP